MNQNFSSWMKLYERRLLIGSAMVFVVVISLLGAWKVWAFGYNGFDLAIYQQVMFNSIHGHLFGLTINPNSFLGDHLELGLVPLLAFYAIAPHPLTLVILQACALAIAVFPLTKIASVLVGRPWHMLFGLMYLANPVVQNMSLFEFHMLPFALPVISYALLAFIERRFRRCILFCALALIIREDVALAIIGFGFLAVIERRSWRWSMVPILLGGAWLVAALALIGHLNGGNQYKFLQYYSSLGSSAGAILLSVFTKPWLFFGLLLRNDNLKFLLVLLMPFAYLPLWRPRWLIPAIPTLLQLLLLPTTGVLLTQIHYPVLLIPFVFTAAAAGWKTLLTSSNETFKKYGGVGLAAVLSVLVILYTMFTLGPFAQALPIVATSASISGRVHLERNIIRMIPSGGVVAGYETITALAARSKLYSLQYVFLGLKQFSDQAYTLPDDASTIVLDLRDFLFFQLNYPHQSVAERGGYTRLRQMIEQRHFQVTTYLDRFAILKEGASSAPPTPLVSTEVPSVVEGTPSMHGELSFLGWSSPSDKLAIESQKIGDATFHCLPVSLTVKKIASSNEIRPIEFIFRTNGQVVYRQLLPLGGGILPSSDWTINQPVTSHYRLLIPSYLTGQTTDVSVHLLDVAGQIGLNGLRSVSLDYSHYRQVGPSIDLGVLTL